MTDVIRGDPVLVAMMIIVAVGWAITVAGSAIGTRPARTRSRTRR